MFDNELSMRQSDGQIQNFLKREERPQRVLPVRVVCGGSKKN